MSILFIRLLFCFFFFKQKTAYEMRISDWSSDVCSSDLPGAAGIVHAILVRDGQRVRAGQPLVELDPTVSDADTAQASKALETAVLDAARLRAVLSALDGQDRKSTRLNSSH